MFVIKLLKYDEKKKLMSFLKNNKIGSQIHYKPIYKHATLKKYISINQSKNSDFFYRRQLTLPLHTLMNSQNINFIVKSLKFFFN